MGIICMRLSNDARAFSGCCRTSLPQRNGYSKMVRVKWSGQNGQGEIRCASEKRRKIRPVKRVVYDEVLAFFRLII